ncbi:MAG: flagellar hook-basal body protein [Planctomycetaceae bacterium]
MSGYSDVDEYTNSESERRLMLSGLYSAASAMDAASLRHETSADNLAHAHQPGFRRRVVGEVAFESVLNPRPGSSARDEAAARLSDASLSVDFRQGPLQQTGRALDVALQGDGFFVVQGPDGPLYTRNGGFHVNGDGQLVTVDQLPVLGEGGPLNLPNGVSSESIQVSASGEVLSGTEVIGQLQLASFDDLSVLLPAGVSLFSAPPNAQVQPANAQIVQGFLEQSNVQAIDELISIMVGSRQYEAAQKAMNAMDESIQKRTRVQ